MTDGKMRALGGEGKLQRAVKASAGRREIVSARAVSLNSGRRKRRRARKSGPFFSSAFSMYSAIAWAAAKWSPIFPPGAPFSWRAMVASLPSRWKSETLSRQPVPMRALE